MGRWKVDAESERGILNLWLSGSFTQAEMRDFVSAHNAAIDRYDGRDYRVWCDIREMHPLSPECAAILEKAKKYSNAQPNFRGSAVWVASAMTALQHRRTSTSGGVMDTELISDDEKRLRAHLTAVNRRHRR